jgi:hypothetical protein
LFFLVFLPFLVLVLGLFIHLFALCLDKPVWLVLYLHIMGRHDVLSVYSWTIEGWHSGSLFVGSGIMGQWQWQETETESLEMGQTPACLNLSQYD